VDSFFGLAEPLSTRASSATPGMTAVQVALAAQGMTTTALAVQNISAALAITATPIETAVPGDPGHNSAPKRQDWCRHNC